MCYYSFFFVKQVVRSLLQTVLWGGDSFLKLIIVYTKVRHFMQLGFPVYTTLVAVTLYNAVGTPNFGLHNVQEMKKWRFYFSSIYLTSGIISDNATIQIMRIINLARSGVDLNMRGWQIAYHLSILIQVRVNTDTDTETP